MQVASSLVDTSCMLDAEADILALDLDCFQLLQGYRQAGLAEKAQRAKDSKKAQAETNAAAAEAAKADLAAAEEADEELASTDADEPGVEEIEATEEDGPQPPKTAKFDVERSDPWIDRICELDGVEPEDLCVLHGKLIAAGFLNFQIRDRHTGIEYRVANAGKQYLTKKLQHASEEIANVA